MNARFYILFVLLAVCLAGCPHNRYKIEMKPAGNVLERTLSVSRVGSGVSPANFQSAETKPATSKSESKVSVPSVPNEELVHISKVYPKSTISLDGEVHKFRIKFTGKTPDDVGGFGSYRQFATRMGYASIYVERFRGDKNPARAVTERLQAVDKLTDLLIGWFQSEMGKDKRFGKLRNFMDKELRRDLKNASMYLWLQSLHSVKDEAGAYEILVRTIHYFMERGYFNLEDLPAITRALMNNKNEDGNITESLVLVQRLMASKMGVRRKEAIPDSLKFLSDAKTVEKSLGVYLRTTKAFKEKLRKWKKQIKTEPDISETELFKILLDPAEKAFHIEMDLFSDDDELDVKLALPVKPFLTNGEWDEKRKKVGWSSTLENRAETYHRLPALCYAVWVVPDKKFQRRHFGRIVLTDQALLEYCLWRNGLTNKEAREWDGFVDKCRPGKSLTDRLKKFRFSDDPAPAETDTQPDSTSRADGIIKKIIGGMQNKN